MQNTIRKIYFVLFCFLSLTVIQCSKDKLPEETQVGNNTFGCLINGEVFKPKGSFISSGYQCYYQHIYPGDNGFVFNVSGSDLSNSSNIPSVTIICDSLKIIENQTYTLGYAKVPYSAASYSITSRAGFKSYVTDSMHVGELTIKKFDEINQIVAGTFWFTAINASGDTVHITEGRFDMKFTR